MLQNRHETTIGNITVFTYRSICIVWHCIRPYKDIKAMLDLLKIMLTFPISSLPILPYKIVSIWCRPMPRKITNKN